MPYTHKQIIELIKTRTGKPMMVRELMRLLRLKSEDRRSLKQVLNELVLSGDIIKTRGNRFGLPEKMDLETGIFQADMQVSLTNDGPVTFILESPKNAGSTH